MLLLVAESAVYYYPLVVSINQDIFLQTNMHGIGGFALLLGGGIFYTPGADADYLEKPNPVPGDFGFHEIWHLFVLGGVFLHHLFMCAGKYNFSFSLFMSILPENLLYIKEN